MKIFQKFFIKFGGEISDISIKRDDAISPGRLPVGSNTGNGNPQQGRDLEVNAPPHITFHPPPPSPS